MKLLFVLKPTFENRPVHFGTHCRQRNLSNPCPDPSFTAPIYASLFDDEDGESSTLIWSRSRKASAD